MSKGLSPAALSDRGMARQAHSSLCGSNRGVFDRGGRRCPTHFLGSPSSAPVLACCGGIPRACRGRSGTIILSELVWPYRFGDRGRIPVCQRPRIAIRGGRVFATRESGPRGWEGTQLEPVTCNAVAAPVGPLEGMRSGDFRVHACAAPGSDPSDCI
jgi:hypothetical protein